MATLEIKGEPLIVFATQLDSWNDAIHMAYMKPKWARSNAQARFMFNDYKRKWREHGYALARYFLDSLWWLTLDTQWLIRKRALVVVKVARATERTYDVHNAYCKALFDGFSDAGVWKDDTWQYVPWVLYGWVHMSDIEERFYTGENTFLIEVYELDGVTFNDVPYILPNFMEAT